MAVDATSPSMSTTESLGIRSTTLARAAHATAPSPETAVLTDVDDRLVWQHFATLPERCKSLLRAIAFAEKPDYASVALALGMPVGSIGPTRGRCLAKLRLALVADPRWEMPS